MTDDNVITFQPKPKEQSELGRWFSTIEERVEGVELDAALVILQNDQGEIITYIKDDMLSTEFIGLMHLAREKVLVQGASH